MLASDVRTRSQLESSRSESQLEYARLDARKSLDMLATDARAPISSLATPGISSETESLKETLPELERNGRKGSIVMEPTERWTPQVASDFYDVASWGKGYFSVGENGHVRVHPEKDPARSIDLKELVDTLVLRGIDLPILIRFADILKHRLGELHAAFQPPSPSTNIRANTAACTRSRSTSSGRSSKRSSSSASRTSSGSRPAPNPS